MNTTMDEEVDDKSGKEMAQVHGPLKEKAKS